MCNQLLEMLMRVRAHVLVTGDVQGVFFRFNTRSQARLRNVTGWVRNLSDGRVEAVLEGEKDNVERLIDFCRKGPSGSRVDDVEVSWEKPSHKHKGFGIRV
jgi:acylphosphatase